LAQVFPLIRASVLVPFLRWSRDNDREAERWLNRAGLAAFPFDEPDRPIALGSALAFVQELATREGPDIGCRVISPNSLVELATLGRVVMGAPTPAEALGRAEAAMTRHCTHERLSVVRRADGIVVREFMAMPMSGEVRHLQQQYVVSLIAVLCRAAGHPGPLFSHVELVPHPQAGLDHLAAWFGVVPVASRSGQLIVHVPSAVADRPFARQGRDRTPMVLPAIWSLIRGDGSYAATVQVIVEMMLEDSEPSVEQLAAAGGVSVRTLQRRLAECGTSYSQLLDRARMARALSRIERGEGRIGELATDLGYAGPAFTRAVRRWAGASPRQLRQRERL